MSCPMQKVVLRCRAFPFDRQRLIVQLQLADSQSTAVRLVPSTVASRTYGPSVTGAMADPWLVFWSISYQELLFPPARVTLNAAASRAVCTVQATS